MSTYLARTDRPRVFGFPTGEVDSLLAAAACVWFVSALRDVRRGLAVHAGHG